MHPSCVTHGFASGERERGEGEIKIMTRSKLIRNNSLAIEKVQAQEQQPAQRRQTVHSLQPRRDRNGVSLFERMLQIQRNSEPILF